MKAHSEQIYRTGGRMYSICPDFVCDIDKSIRAALINRLGKESCDRICDTVDTLLRYEKKTK